MDSPDGHDEQLWRELAALGICGLAVPEAFGGAGASFVEVSIACEELGRSCVRPVPVVDGTGAVCSPAFVEPALQRRGCGGASGELMGTVALDEPQRSWLGATRSGGDKADGQWSLSGFQDVRA
jgi:alkylation response protein AidB-like acyl-CoA dehydrogenase